MSNTGTRSMMKPQLKDRNAFDLGELNYSLADDVSRNVEMEVNLIQNAPSAELS